MGGSGKSDINLTDKSNVNVLYLAPSWKLTMNKQREYKEIENDKNIWYSVWKRALSTNPHVWQELVRYSNTIIVDEVSMMTETMLNTILNRFRDC